MRRNKKGKRIHPERTKIKLVPYGRLYKQTWDLMSKYVRERDKWTCITCKKHIPGLGNGMQAGHYVHGNVYDFNFKDVNAQCKRCNFLMAHPNADAYQTYDRYTTEIDKKWGEGTAQALKDGRHQINKLTRYDLINIQNKIADLTALLMTDIIYENT